MKTRIASCLILVACFSIVKCVTLPKDSSPEGPIATQIKLPALFSDHMVLQQNKPVKVWGWAEPGGVVTVTFRGEKKRARAGADGAWHLNLRAHKAGGPFTMQIMGQDTLVLTDILIGEVWICSGQSNMQWPVSQTRDAENVMKNANYTGLRLFSVEHRTSTVPQKMVPSSGWQVCTPSSVPAFSAVGYFFGRYLHETLDIPLGLIHSSWGGTPAEAWTSRKAIEKFPDFQESLKNIEKVGKEQDGSSYESREALYQKELKIWMEDIIRLDPGSKPGEKSWSELDLDASSWGTMSIPSLWESTIGDYDGIVWFRKECTLKENWKAKEADLFLGPINDMDVTWVNGFEVGRTDISNSSRHYRIPAGLLKEGKNVIAVRVLDYGRSGGIWGKPDDLTLISAGDTVKLAGIWMYRAGTDKTMPAIPRQPERFQSMPTMLFNAMIAPLIGYGIKGAIWYQGESNATRAYQYRTLFPAMIEDWRSYWNEEFPFLFVQLANFKAIQNEPREDDWAELREAQLMTLALPNTGMVVTIDIGDADDIHPRNKQEVGKRLGLNALKQVYGKDVVHSGPAYRSMRIEKDALRLLFDHTFGGLVAKNGEQLVGFAIAGKDRKFVWADAVIEGTSVLAKSPLVKDPEAVRYAWASNPVCNLYNKAGLPASPFRTDTWPGITQPKEIDICIYGGTSSGIIAGVAAARMGKKPIVIEPGKYIGGLATGGLGQTDIGNKYAITGLSRDFYRRIGNEYGHFEGWTFSPSVALKVYQDMIQEVNLEVIREFELISVEKEGSRIRSVTVENKGTGARMVVRAKQFIDATYEGDLMARSGVSYTVGRESNAQYGEKYNGVQLREYHQFPDGIDPYRIKGNPASGLLWGIQEEDISLTGSGDRKVQAYNFRLCLTQDKSNQLPFYPPEEYHPEHYELLLRIMEVKPWNSIHDGMIIKMMPGGKTDINNRGPFSTDLIGGSWDYPEASYKRRKEIWKAHEDYIKGLLYFLSHDERVPVKIREEMSGWGYACDEFADNGGFPNQLYVREARRMVGEYVMTEHNCVGDSVVKDGIGMAAYTMDSHNCQRIVINGMVKNEGDVQIGGFPPYPVSFRSITPRKEECTNLLVPVCLSASHIAFGSIRMEPVFMVLGQSAAVAACLSIDEIKPVQEADVVHIQEILRNNPLLDGAAPEILVDNSDAGTEITGRWRIQKGNNSYVKDFLLSEAGSESASVTFRPLLYVKGKYKLYCYSPNLDPFRNEPLAEQIVCQVKHQGGVTEKVIPFEKTMEDWYLIGEFLCGPGDTVIVLKKSTGVVAVDAVILQPQF